MASAVLKRFTAARSASDSGYRGLPLSAEDHSCDSAGSSIGSRKRKRNENERLVAKVPLKRSKSAYGSLSRGVTVMELDGPIRKRKEIVEPQEEEDPETEPEEEEAVDSCERATRLLNIGQGQILTRPISRSRRLLPYVCTCTTTPAITQRRLTTTL